MPTATDTKQTGKQQTRPPLTVRQKAMIARQHARTAHHHTRGVQKQVAPFVGMGLLVLAAAALHAATTATDADAEILGTAAATYIVFAVVAAKQLRKRLDDKKMLVRAQAFLAIAGPWLITTASWGVTWDAVGLLVAVGSVLSLHWWRKHRIPNLAPSAAPATETAAPAEPGWAYFRKRWEEWVSCPGGQLPGSKLESPEQVKAG